MATIIALLRGINVGGTSKLAMADLRALFVALGYADARTHIQTGNVIFTAPDAESDLATEIEQRIAADLGVSCRVLLRTRCELAAAIRANPFVARGADPKLLHVTFLADAPDPARAEMLAHPSAAPDELALVHREVFVHCPNGYGRTKLNNTFVEKRLGVAATTRNWNVVNKLHELLAE